MGLWLREKKDGTRAPGYLVYLIGGLGLAAAAALLLPASSRPGSPVRDDAAAASPAGRSPPPRPEGTAYPPAASALGPAAGPGPIFPPPRPGRSAPPAAPDGAGAEAGGFDPIANAADEEGSEPDAPATAEPAAPSRPAYAPLPPALPPESSQPRSRRAAQDPAAGLFGYRDETSDQAEPSSAPAPSGQPADYFVPRGTLIEACLLTTADTGNPSAVLQFACTRAVVFNHRRQLPFGTRFLGQLSGAPVRDRLNLTADTVLYPDGLELPIKASAVEADDSGADIQPGLRAEYFPLPPWPQIAPYLSEVVTGYLGLLQSRAQSQATLSLGGLGLLSTGGAGAQAPLYQASAQALQNFTAQRLKEMEQRYASHYAIPAGTACWLQLSEDLDLNKAHARHEP